MLFKLDLLKQVHLEIFLLYYCFSFLPVSKTVLNSPFNASLKRDARQQESETEKDNERD